MITLADLPLGKKVALSGVVRTLDITNGKDDEDPDFGLLPDGEVLVTLHVDLNEQAPRYTGSDYAKVYNAAHAEELARPGHERTRLSHAVAADAVAVHAFLDAALALEESDGDFDEAASILRDRTANIENGRSSTFRRHKATQDVVAQMGPAYGTWVTRNSPAVARRLEDFVDADTAKVLLAHFHISEKDEG